MAAKQFAQYQVFGGFVGYGLIYELPHYLRLIVFAHRVYVYYVYYLPSPEARRSMALEVVEYTWR